MKRSVMRWGLAASFVLAIAGCGGGGGGDAPPTTTPDVPPPTGAATVNAASLATADYAALAPRVTVGRVVIQSPPVVHFSLADANGNPIVGFGSTSRASNATVAQYPNLSFSLAKLVPGSNGSPSKWVNYIVTTVPTTTQAAAPTRPSTDNTGTLTDFGNGTYTYTFYRDITTVKDQVAAMTVTGAANNKDDLGDLTYEPNLVHRLTIQISGNVPGTGTNTPNGVQSVTGVPLKNPVNAIYDFIPATGQPATAADASREIVAVAKCDECHQKLGGIPGDDPGSSAAAFHGSSRTETRYCVVCHTEQRKYGQTEATIDATTLTFTSGTRKVNGRAIGNMPNNIHKIHMGSHLAKKNYDYAGVTYNHIRFPQDVRNCTKCHDGSDTSTAKTAQGDNWKNVPSRLACGACHDGINFENGTGVTLADAAKGLVTSPQGHVGGAQPDDSLCSLCHKPAGIDLVHTPITPPNPGNALAVNGGSANSHAAWIASNTSRLPAGAVKVTYDIQSVALNGTRNPTMKFRILQNGNRADFNDPAAKPEIWDGFMGAPSVYFVFAMPQDGITAPSDFNASASMYLRTLWKAGATGTSFASGTNGNLTGPDADGYYTATLTNVTIPTTARMLTGGVGYSYNVATTMPLTQTNLEAFPVTDATATTGLTAGMPNKLGGLLVIAPNAQKVANGFTGRRAIVDDAKCSKCHQELGAFTTEAFHGGQRNDGTTCSWCHTPNRASSGWSADSTSFVHAVHAGAKRSKPFTWHALSETESFADIGYPGILDRCEQCHVPGSYDFGSADAKNALPNKQYRTVATGTPNPTTPLAVFSQSPYVTTGTAYGSGYSYSATAGTITEAAATTLVISPMTAACFSCHDSELATQHMETFGGSIYKPRSTALAKLEQCAFCHASGAAAADIKTVHAR